MKEEHSKELSKILSESVKMENLTSRRALCTEIKFSEPTLELLNASCEDFSIILIDRLTATENEASLCKLCNILLREFEGSKKSLLREILKEYCIKEDNIDNEVIVSDDSIKLFLEAMRGKGCSESEKVSKTSLEYLFHSIEDELINNHRYWRYFKLSTREINIKYVSRIYFHGLAEKTECTQKFVKELISSDEDKLKRSLPRLLQALKEIWYIHCDFKGLLSINPDAARNLFLLGVIEQVLNDTQSLRKFVMTLRTDIRKKGFLTVANRRQLKNKLLKVEEILDNSSKIYRDLICEASKE